MDLELGACLFHKHWQELCEFSVDGGDQAGFGVMGGHVGDVLDVWPNEVVQRVQIGGGGGEASERRVQSRSTPSEASLGLFGLMGRCRVQLPHLGSATGHLIAPGDHHTLQHILVHFGVDFQADFEDVRWHDVVLTWNLTKDHNCSRKLCFHHPGHVPVIRGNPDLHFEGAGNGPVVITWIGREHELYSSASLILLVEHYVTFRHDRTLLSILGFVHNWPTSRWSVTKKRKPVFIKWKWNHIFSRATILLFHSVFEQTALSISYNDNCYTMNIRWLKLRWDEMLSQFFDPCIFHFGCF